MTQEEVEKRINEIVAAWSVLHPEEELAVISLPKYNSEERRRILVRLRELL